MKSINTEKLRAMGLDRAKAACVLHAEKAFIYRDAGNARMFDRHLNLLDQCAAIGRALKGSTNTPIAREVIAALR